MIAVVRSRLDAVGHFLVLIVQFCRCVIQTCAYYALYQVLELIGFVHAAVILAAYPSPNLLFKRRQISETRHGFGRLIRILRRLEFIRLFVGHYLDHHYQLVHVFSHLAEAADQQGFVVEEHR